MSAFELLNIGRLIILRGAVPVVATHPHPTGALGPLSTVTLIIERKPQYMDIKQARMLYTVVMRIKPQEIVMAKNQSHTGHRSSKTGRFVKESYAKKHPNTTQKESIPNPGRGDTGRSGKK